MAAGTFNVDPCHLTRVPGVLLIVLTSFGFETNGTNTSSHYDGPHVGAVLACLIGIVLMFKLVRIWADILVDRGRISERPRFYFDWLILAVIFIPCFGYVAQGTDIITVTGERAPSWRFEWGMGASGMDYRLSAVIALVFLLRVYAVARVLFDAYPSGCLG